MIKFKDLFLGSTKKDHTPSPEAADRSAKDELFIDTESPAEAGSDRMVSELDRLIERDLCEEGRIAGFRFHDMDIYRAMADQYRAEIIRAIDGRTKQLDELLARFDEEIAKLQGEPMGVTLKGIQATRVRYAKEHLSLSEQRMLVLGNSGMAEASLASFGVGFKQGYNLHLETIGLIAQYAR